jgi:hypothetical protein
MLETLTLATFTDCVGNVFRLHRGAAAPLDVELTEATPLGAEGTERPAGRREPFAIVFRGPRHVVLPQKIYALEHPRLGTLELFVVPIGPDAQGMRYEAVFN